MLDPNPTLIEKKKKNFKHFQNKILIMIFFNLKSFLFFMELNIVIFKAGSEPGFGSGCFEKSDPDPVTKKVLIHNTS